MIEPVEDNLTDSEIPGNRLGVLSIDGGWVTLGEILSTHPEMSAEIDKLIPEISSVGVFQMQGKAYHFKRDEKATIQTAFREEQAGHTRMPMRKMRPHALFRKLAYQAQDVMANGMEYIPALYTSGKGAILLYDKESLYLHMYFSESGYGIGRVDPGAIVFKSSDPSSIEDFIVERGPYGIYLLLNTFASMAEGLNKGSLPLYPIKLFGEEGKYNGSLKIIDMDVDRIKLQMTDWH